MNHDEVAFLLAVGYSLSEIMRMAANRAQGTEAAQDAQGAQGATGGAEGAQAAGAATEGAQGAPGGTEGAQAAGAATEGAQAAEAATEGAQDDIEAIKRENEQLKKQIQEQNRKNAVFEQAKEKTLDEILFKIMEDYK